MEVVFVDDSRRVEALAVQVIAGIHKASMLPMLWMLVVLSVLWMLVVLVVRALLSVLVQLVRRTEVMVRV